MNKKTQLAQKDYRQIIYNLYSSRYCFVLYIVLVCDISYKILCLMHNYNIIIHVGTRAHEISYKVSFGILQDFVPVYPLGFCEISYEFSRVEYNVLKCYRH